MAIFGIEVEEDEKAELFFSETNARLNDDNLVRNPFNGGIKHIKHIYVIDLEPVYIHFSPITFAIGTVSFFAFGLRWWTICFFAVSSLGIFWSKYFFQFFINKGLRKAGYKGRIKYFSQKEIIREAIL